MNIVTTSKLGQKKKITLQTIEKNYNIIVLTSLLAFGIIIGSMIISRNSSDLSSSISTLYDNFITSIKEKRFISTFFDTFSTSMVYVFLFFITGTNALGIPFIYFLTCIKGIGNGIISGYLYITFGLQGVGFSTLVLFPYALSSGIIIIMMGNSSLKMSKSIFSGLNTKFSNRYEITIKKYCINFLIYTAFFIVASLIDAIFKVSFSGVFNI